MTDGIIQKVFNKSYEEIARLDSPEKERILRSVLYPLENELMEEIKKELSDRNYEDYIDKPIIEELKRIITGDNQE